MAQMGPWRSGSLPYYLQGTGKTLLGLPLQHWLEISLLCPQCKGRILEKGNVAFSLLLQKQEAEQRRTDPAYMSNNTIMKWLSGYHKVCFFVLYENFFGGQSIQRLFLIFQLIYSSGEADSPRFQCCPFKINLMSVLLVRRIE